MNFVPDLIQVELEPFQASFIPGDEPLKYIDSQTSKQEAVQKHFLSKGYTGNKESSQEHYIIY